MKCPKCGTVSIPGLDQCKNCGHRFTQVSGEALKIPSLFHQSPEGRSARATLDFQPDEDLIGIDDRGPSAFHTESEREAAFPSSTGPDENTSGQKQSQSYPAWQAELAERVQEYRQRRSRFAKKERTSNETLDFDFESQTSGPEDAGRSVLEFPSHEESGRHSQSTSEEPSDQRSSALGDLELTREYEDNRINSASRPKPKPPAETGPLEIELESSLAIDDLNKGDSSTGPVASLGTRFVAGIIDALVLFSGAVIYGLIFWRTGGQFALQPLDLAVAGVIGVFFAVLYFAGCTALASATPGLMWAGLEVRTFEGNPPGPSECFWRAFGYLVSMSALMLGFVWAVVDADGLTWHDRMSRTFLTSVNQQ